MYPLKRYNESLEKIKSYETLHSGQKATPMGGRYTSLKSFGSSNRDIEGGGRQAMASSRSTKLITAGMKFKSNFNRTQFFGQDKIKDSVAESLFKIQDKLNRKTMRRNGRIATQQHKLRDYHSQWSDRRDSLSQRSFEDSEQKYLENVQKR